MQGRTVKYLALGVGAAVILCVLIQLFRTLMNRIQQSGAGNGQRNLDTNLAASPTQLPVYQAPHVTRPTVDPLMSSIQFQQVPLTLISTVQFPNDLLRSDRSQHDPLISAVRSQHEPLISAVQSQYDPLYEMEAQIRQLASMSPEDACDRAWELSLRLTPL